MLNYETLLSSYDDKLTLMQWLKKVEAALNDASAVSFNVNKKGDATLTFSIVFEDGSEIESGEIVLQQGESVESAAIVNGHLILTLTNGDELDAGQLLNGDLNVNGNLTVSGNVKSDGFLMPATTAKAFSDGTFEKTLSIASQVLLDNDDNQIGQVTFPFVYMRISNGKLSVVCCVTFDITQAGTPRAISFSAQTSANGGLLSSLVPIDTSLPYGVLDKRSIPSIVGTNYQIAKTSDNGYQYIRTATDSYGYLMVSGYISGANFTSTGKYFIRYEANFII